MQFTRKSFSPDSGSSCRTRIDRTKTHGIRRSPCSQTDHVIADTGARRVTVVNQHSPHKQRRRMHELACVMHRETFCSMVYFKSPEAKSRDIHFFIGADLGTHRLVSLLAMEKRDSIRRYSWPEWDARPRIQASSRTEPALWSVSLIWTAASRRREGWARLLITSAMSHLLIPSPSQLAWQMPFFDDGAGEATARALCPEGLVIAA